VTIIVLRNQEAAGRTRQGNASAQPCATRDSAYENERAKHAPDTALVRFADIVAGKASEKEDAK